MELLTLLLDPKFISIVGPLGILAVVEGYVIYKLFDKHEKLQEARLNEWRSMVEDYNKLCSDVNKTLDTLLKVVGRNGNGGSK
jgi:hypothetical protein